MEFKKFIDVDLSDAFFDSLKADYPGFSSWYTKKANAGESAFVDYDRAEVIGFLYSKVEDGVIDDVSPTLAANHRLKIGTFKVDSRGTRFGEWFLKKALDQAVAHGVNEVYVTVFPKHIALIRLLEKYGFINKAEKPAANGEIEQVLVRDMRIHNGDLMQDYPFGSCYFVCCLCLWAIC